MNRGQPSGQADSPSARQTVAQAVARSATTLLGMAPPAADMLDRWRQGFALTYGAELRAERGDRPGAIVDWDAAR